METYTIKEDAKQAIVEFLNRIIQVEYDTILNYPRLIDKLVNIDKIHDEQLNKDLEYVGKASVQHFGSLSRLIELLGGETKWVLGTIERLVDVGECMTRQLEKEKEMRSLYEEAKQLVEKNKVKVKGPGFFSKLVNRLAGGAEEVKAVDAAYIVGICERHRMEEERHIRLVDGSIKTLKALTDRKTE